MTPARSLREMFQASASTGHESVYRNPVRSDRLRSKSAKSQPFKRTVGLTMVEMLVVFVLLALVSTLLFQGTGFFATHYEAVQRVHREGSVTGLQQHWFVSTVRSLAAYGHRNGRFRGNEEAFEGITLQALAGEPGMPVRARWYVDGRGARQSLVYNEERGASAGGVEWPVLEADEPGLRFLYADSQGQWRRRWPVDDEPTAWLPRAIRLVGASGNTVLLARVGTSAFPGITDEDLR